MTKPYTGKDSDRRYEGETVDITFNLKRCIHAQECVKRLNEVFDTKKRPWIQPDNASADAAADVIHRCPSGALHYDRKDGGEAEPIPTENTMVTWAKGPIQFTGDLEIRSKGVEIEQETRATLCRCGESKNKPFCDNSHNDIDFVPEDPAAIEINPDVASGGKLKIEAYHQGPLGVHGAMTIKDAEGNILHQGEESYLCRCGASKNKPFCDGSHHGINFEVDEE